MSVYHMYVLDPLELELQVMSGHSSRVLGPELGSSGRVANGNLNHRAISPAPKVFL